MFAQSDLLNDFDNSFSNKHIDIRLVQRNGKKCTTTVEGLVDSETLKLKEMLSAYKKMRGCQGSMKNENGKVIISFTGNQTEKFRDYLLENSICEESDITIHGG
jgi:translation initiation factor 1